MRPLEFVYENETDERPKFIRIYGQLFRLHDVEWRQEDPFPFATRRYSLNLVVTEVPPPPPAPKRKKMTPADLRLRKPEPEPAEDEHEDYYPEYDYLDDEY